MSYKDMTFCKFYGSCDNGEFCDRALTPKVIKSAQKWWGAIDAPICQYVIHPECYKRKEINKNWLNRI